MPTLRFISSKQSCLRTSDVWSIFAEKYERRYLDQVRKYISFNLTTDLS